MKYLQIELPSLHLNWVRENGDEYICSIIRTNYPKPGLTFVPSIIRQTGVCDIELIDMKIRNQDTIISYKEFKYGDGVMVCSRMGIHFEETEKKIVDSDILGLSINFTSWANIALDFIKYAKDINPELIVIVGGSDPMFRDDYYLNTANADIVIRGEAEYNLPDLIKAIESKKDISEINGISFKNGDKIVRNQINSRTRMQDIPLQCLDLLKNDISFWTTPAEYFPLPKGVSTPFGFMFLTRGCFETCNFCTTPAKMGKFRFNNFDRINQELEYFKEFGISTINVWDDSLTSILKMHPDEKVVSKKYLINIMQLFRERRIAYEFSQGVVIKHLWDEEKNCPDFELIEALYSNEINDGKFIGCYGEFFPTECLQEDNRFEKLMTFEKEKEVLKAILDAGTKLISYSSIMGTKDDTQKSFECAVRKSKELNEIIESRGGKALATPFIFSLFPGAKVVKQYQNKIEYPIEKYPELCQLNAAIHKTDYFKPHELILAKKNMERKLMSQEQFNKWNQTGRYQWK
jgi:hopanoid C-3 methylase